MRPAGWEDLVICIIGLPPLVVAGYGSVLVASPPGGPFQPVPGIFDRVDDQRAEQRGDLVAGERDLVVWRRGGVLGGGGDGQGC